MDLTEFFKLLKGVEGPISIILLVVIAFLFRHIDVLTKNIISNTATLEKLSGLITILCSNIGRRE